MAKLSFSKIGQPPAQQVVSKTIDVTLVQPAQEPASAAPAAAPESAQIAEAPAAVQAAPAPTLPATAAVNSAAPAPTASASAFAKLVSGPSPAPAAPAAAPVSAATAVGQVTQNQAVVPYQAVRTPAPAAPVVGAPTQWIRDDDNISMSDIVLPRLNLVQKSGELSNLFAPGTILLDKEIPVGNQEVPAKIAIIGFRSMQYVERVENTSELGRICNTPQEVEELGGTTDWTIHNTTQQPIFQKMATAMVVVQRPEGCVDEDHFPYDFEGQRYAVAMWSMKGTAFTHGAKNIFTARRFGALKGGYITKWYLITTFLKTYGKNFAFVPVLKLGEPTPPFLRDLATAILS